MDANPRRFDTPARESIISAMKTGILLCLLLLVPSQAQTFVDGPDAEPGFGHLCCQTGGALLVGGLLMSPVIATVHGLADMPGDPEAGSIIGTYIGLIGAATLYPLGSAAGTTIAGAIGRQHGNFGYSYLGALLGLPVGYGIAAGGVAISRRNSALQAAFMILGCLAPPVGATAGYNFSRSRGDQFGRLERRLLTPSLGVKSEPQSRGTAVALDMKLLNVGF